MLVIDSGNTRTKFAIYRGDKQQYEAKVVNTDLSMTMTPQWLTELQQEMGGDRVCVGSSVGEPSAANTIQQRLTTIDVEVTWLTSQPRCGALLNGYGESYEKLGADRWFALLGYFFDSANNSPCDAVIIDAGTALTIDWLAAGGQHLGGWIVPGRRLMQESLHNGTAHLRDTLTEECYRQPATSTQQAMSHGVHYALVGAIAQALGVADSQFGQGNYKVIVTGGDGERLIKSLQSVQVVNYQRIDDLVFKGLRVAADKLK